MSYPGYQASPNGQMNAAQQQQAAQQRFRQQQAAQQQQQTAVNAVAPASGQPQQVEVDALRAAKRRKPTDRALPTFLPSPSTHPAIASSTETLEVMSKGYKSLQAVERRLDWTLARKRIELAEQAQGGRMAGVTKTLRVHLEATLVDQSWQKTRDELDALKVGPDPTAPGLSAPPPAPSQPQVAPDAEPVLDIAVDGAAKAPDVATATPAVETPATSLPTTFDLSTSSSTIPVSFSTGEGIPRFEVVVKSELLNEDTPESKVLSSYVKRMIVETDRDAGLYDRTGPIEWRSSAVATPALSLTYPTSLPTRLRFSIYLAHSPEQFTLVPEFASLLDLQYGDRVTVLAALWGYVRGKRLIDEERKQVRTDAGLKKLFAGQEKVPFHHLPEYVNRFLVPLQPVVLEYTVPMEGTTHHVAFDLDITVPDVSQSEVERVASVLNAPNEKVNKELQILDEKIASTALLVRSSHLKRSLLAAFASSPIPTLESYISSQSSDLDTVLSSGTTGGWVSMSDEDARRAEGWTGEWVQEGAGVWSGRRTEGKLREMMAQQQQQGVQGGQQFGGQRR